jgi:hypothetical protein
MRRTLIGIIVVLTVLAAGCSSKSAKVAPTSGSATPSATSTPTPTAPPYRPVIDPASFTTTVTNKYFPLVPGTKHVFIGTKDGKPERVEMTVLRETRTIMGVKCAVISDIVTSNDTLVEKTTDWYAQDKVGNVWYFGEDSKDYTNGVVSSTQGTWEAGVDNAQPGIVMHATPTVGEEYRQEYRPGVAEDKGKVLQVDAALKVPYGSSNHVVYTLDTDPLNPDKIEHKWYGAGIGMLAAVREGSAHHESIKLVSTTHG